MYTTKIGGIGKYLPELEVSNEDLSHLMETTDEWIQERTGIKTRRYGKKHEETQSGTISS